jgi:uncharacterized SAM-binding protein YcdF (DUF218 family)
VVVVVRDADTFARAVQQAVETVSPSQVQRRIEVAKQNSWETRIEQMSELIEKELTAARAVGGRWEESLRRLYRIARRRIVRIAAGALAAYLLLFYSPFIWLMAEPLRVVDQVRPADAIVVFGGGVGESGKAGGGYQERVRHAVDLYRADSAPRLIFSSGFAFAFQEAEVMRELAVGQGVPAPAIMLETKAASTFENVMFVRAILARHGWQRILLVSSPYHMRRAMLTWRKVAPGVQVLSSPVKQSQFYVRDRGASLEQIRGILHEYVAIVVYWWRGWI